MSEKTILAEANPDLAAQWHPTKNGDLTPDMVTCGSNKKVWWFLPYDDPETGKHFDFEWNAQISSRTKERGCPFLTGNAVHPGFNDLATKRPDLTVQWHPTKNGTLLPEMVTCNSGKKVWWYLPYVDPKTGRHFDFEWEERIKDRNRRTNCPYLSGHQVWQGFNDLATNRPDLAAQWHPSKNGDLTPEKVTCWSNRIVWWYLPYDDVVTGKHFDFEWEEMINARNRGHGCPYLSGHKVLAGFNDLATKRPDLAIQWHPTKNGNLTPEHVTCMSQKKVWWCLPYDDPETGKHFVFEWEDSIYDRSGGRGCPFLSSHRVWPGFNDLATKRPELAARWNHARNGELKPEMLTCTSNKKVWWYLPYDDPETGQHFDFEWEESVSDRERGYGCPILSGRRVWSGFNDLASCYPEIASEWHPVKNRRRTPDQIYKETTKKVWWICRRCGHEWYAPVKGRTIDGAGCPVCRKTKTYDI